MPESKITLVEYHNHGTGPQFFPDLFAGSAADEAEESSESEDDEGGNGLAVLVGVLVLLGIAVAIKYLYGDEEEELPPEDEHVEVTEYEE